MGPLFCPHLVTQLGLVQPAVAGCKFTGSHHGHIHSPGAHLLAQTGGEAVHGRLGGTLDSPDGRWHAIQAGGQEDDATMGTANQGQEDLG